MPATNNSIIALDVGSKRIGIAVASMIARLPHPLATLGWDDNFFSELKTIIQQENVSDVVVGLPRGLQGQDTDQTQTIQDFIQQLKQNVDIPVHVQDEAVTSQHAEAELRERGKPYDKGDIDALAATYILDDWLAEHGESAV